MFAASFPTIDLCTFTDYGPGTKVYLVNSSDTGLNAVTKLLWLDGYTNLVQAGDETGLQQMARKHQIVVIPDVG